MEIETKIVPVLILILLVPLTSYEEQGVGSLQIDMKSSWGNERVDYHGMSLKVYQDSTVTPFKTIDSLSENPYKVPLPIGHRYKIEAYVSSMYASVGYVNLQNNNEKLELIIPISGSVRFTAVYNDGNTPIDGASVKIKSHDGTYEYWTASTTDTLGNTIRFWLQPTILDNDYYIADISIGNDLLYSYYPLNIRPGTSRDVKIVTPWPEMEPQLVVSVYQSPLQKISKPDGDFTVELYDSNKEKIATSKVSSRGDAYFSNLKVGSYTLRVVNLNDAKNVEWGTANMIVDGKQSSIQIFKNQPAIKNEEPVKTTIVTNSTENITQDLILNTIQTEKINNNAIKPIIPAWIKNMADWWVQGKISDLEFLKSIEYMVQNKIINIQFVEDT
jgi:hypothetical protein